MQSACAIVNCGLPGSEMFFFNITSHKARFRTKKKVKGTEHEMHVLFTLKIPSENFLILRRIERDMIKNVNTSSCKVSIILVRF